MTGAGNAASAGMDPDADRREHRFGASAPLSIGVEEELLLVDSQLRLSTVGEQIAAAVEEPLRDRVSTEIFAGQIEIKTDVCDGAEEARRQLAELRRAVRATGPGLLAAGLHPSDRSGEARLVDKPRYASVQKDLGGLLRTPPCGLHVHVGMPDPETAIHVANAFRDHLPLLQALSANSPFWEGVDSGHASGRTAVVHSYPRFEMPRAFRDYEEFCEVTDQLLAAAGAKDYTYIWWDVRPHPRLGTVEVRAVDVQTDVATSAALAALIQALAAKEIERPGGHGIVREALEESYFQAARYGLEARLMVDEGSAEPVAEVARRTLDEVRPYARDLGGEAALEELERVLREGNGAQWQRRLHAERGMDGLLRELAAASVPPA